MKVGGAICLTLAGVMLLLAIMAGIEASTMQKQVENFSGVTRFANDMTGVSSQNSAKIGGVQLIASLSTVFAIGFAGAGAGLLIAHSKQNRHGAKPSPWQGPPDGR